LNSFHNYSLKQLLNPVWIWKQKIQKLHWTII